MPSGTLTSSLIDYSFPMIPDGVEIRVIPGYDDYAATTDGRIYSFRNKTFLKPQKQSSGYHMVSLYTETKKKRWLIHRIIAITFLGLPEGNMDVNHKDCDKHNNHLSNLEWVSRQENVIHAMNNNRSKYKLLEVELIKDGEIHKVVNLAAFAKANGLTSQNLFEVVNKKRLSHKGWKLYDPEQEVSLEDLK